MAVKRKAMLGYMLKDRHGNYLPYLGRLYFYRDRKEAEHKARYYKYEFGSETTVQKVKVVKQEEE